MRVLALIHLLMVISLLCLFGCPDVSHLGSECVDNSQCDISWGEYCSLQGCGEQGTSGTCTIKPTQLECSYVNSFLVCGCNDVEYPSSCWAANDRQSIKNYGPCEE